MRNMFDLVPFGNKHGLAPRDAFQRFFDHIFNDEFLSFPQKWVGANSFKVDVRETENSYLIEADLPGIKKEDVNVEYDNRYLTISAKKEDMVEQKAENFVRRERHYGEFRRSFYVDNIDENNITANLADGVLKVTLPKKNKGIAGTKKIEIQ